MACDIKPRSAAATIEMGSWPIEGIYASLQSSPPRSSFVQSPHELQNDVPLHSQSFMNQDLGLTHLPDSQLHYDSQPLEFDSNFLDEIDALSGLFSTNNPDSYSTDAPTHDTNLPPERAQSQSGISTLSDIIQECETSTTRSPSGQIHSSEPQTPHAPYSPPGLIATEESRPNLEGITRKRTIDDIISANEHYDPAKRQCRDRTPSFVAPSDFGFNESNQNCSRSTGINANLGLESYNENELSTKNDAAVNSCNTESNMTSLDQIQHTLILPPSTQLPTPPSAAQTPFLESGGNSQSRREASLDSLFEETDSSDETSPNHASPSAVHDAPFPPELDFSSETTSGASHQIIQSSELQKEDLRSHQLREVLQNLRRAPKYISPYPNVGGPLGYLPSNPTLHVKCIEVADDEVASRIGNYRKKISSLRYERDKYLPLPKQSTGAGCVAEKTKEQQMREESMFLKRALTVKGKKANEAVKEAKKAAKETQFWRSEYRKLAVTYNNMLYQFTRPQIQAIPAPPDTQTAAPPPQSPPSNVVGDAHVPPMTETTPSNPITIDLTNDEGEVQRNGRIQSPQLEPNIEALNTMRTKEYSWLNNQHSANQPLPLGGAPGLQKAPHQSSAQPGHHPQSDFQDETAQDIGAAVVVNSESQSDSRLEEDDDELARMFLSELEASGFT